jgi:MerR family transcriptional regulator, light-induced transcriptional regulator
MRHSNIDGNRERAVDNTNQQQGGNEQDGASAQSQPTSTELLMLSQTLERELIPRLMEALKSSTGSDIDLSDSLTTTATSKAGTDSSAVNATASAITATEVEEFIHLIIHHDASIGRGYVQALRERGVKMPVIYMQLFAVAARRLGSMWDDDECDFTQVTIAVCRMHQLIHSFSDGQHDQLYSHEPASRNILLLPADGEQHTFGLLMAGEFFRNAGWNVYNGAADSEKELLGILARQSFDAVGVSISAERNQQALHDQIVRLREVSRNKHLLIVAGGHLINTHPEKAQELGADCAAHDGDGAVSQVTELLQTNQGH